MINFTKMHGLGNDYLFINCINNRFNTEKVAQIQNIISRELKSKVENIHISNK